MGAQLLGHYAKHDPMVLGPPRPSALGPTRPISFESYGKQDISKSNTVICFSFLFFFSQGEEEILLLYYCYCYFYH